MASITNRRILLAVAAAVVAVSIVVAVLTHFALGLFSLRIAVATSSMEGRQAASALAQVFAANHPRLRVTSVPQSDLLTAAAALDKNESDLAIVRSDAPAQDGQTLVILRRDAALFVVPGGSAVDSVGKLRGGTVAFLSGRKLDERLFDVVLAHFGIPRESVRREYLDLDRIPDALHHKRIGAFFIVAPASGKVWPPLFAALRKHGEGHPKMFEVDEAAAIAKEHPVLETIDVPKGTFQGSPPAPGDDVTTLSVTYRLVAQSAMPDWLAGDITREILSSKTRLATIDPGLSDIEAPDTDDRTQALPIHPGAAAYLTGSLPSFSDQVQTGLYWLGLAASAAASLSAVGAALYQKFRPRRPPTRVMRLLELWVAVRSTETSALTEIETETDAIVDAAIRAEAHGRADGTEMRLVTLVASHVRDAIHRRQQRAGERLHQTPL